MVVADDRDTQYALPWLLNEEWESAATLKAL